MGLTFDLHQQIFRGKAPAIFLAQPEGLGYGVIVPRRLHKTRDPSLPSPLASTSIFCAKTEVPFDNHLKPGLSGETV